MNYTEMILKAMEICIHLFIIIELIIKGCNKWRKNKNGQSEEQKSKSRRGMLQMIIGIIGILIVLIFFRYVVGIALSMHGENAAEETNTEEKSTESSATEDVSSESVDNGNTLIYVKNEWYKGENYTGYVDSQTRTPSGHGVMKYANGGSYDGEWENGVQQGNGTMIYYNGDKYEGEWQDGKKNGYGTYTWSDERKYIGNYKDDKRDGYGEFIGWTGFESIYGYGWKGNYYGISEEDKFEGDGIFEFDNGDKFVGTFHADGFWEGTYTYSNGRTYEINKGKFVP